MPQWRRTRCRHPLSAAPYRHQHPRQPTCRLRRGQHCPRLRMVCHHRWPRLRVLPAQRRLLRELRLAGRSLIPQVPILMLAGARLLLGRDVKRLTPNSCSRGRYCGARLHRGVWGDAVRWVCVSELPEDAKGWVQLFSEGSEAAGDTVGCVHTLYLRLRDLGERCWRLPLRTHWCRLRELCGAQKRPLPVGDAVRPLRPC